MFIITHLDLSNFRINLDETGEWFATFPTKCHSLSSHHVTKKAGDSWIQHEKDCLIQGGIQVDDVGCLENYFGIEINNEHLSINLKHDSCCGMVMVDGNMIQSLACNCASFWLMWCHLNHVLFWLRQCKITFLRSLSLERPEGLFLCQGGAWYISSFDLLYIVLPTFAQTNLTCFLSLPFETLFRGRCLVFETRTFHLQYSRIIFHLQEWNMKNLN